MGLLVHNLQSSTSSRVVIFTASLTFVSTTFAPTVALAIPSPELVIGSVSSLSQLFALGAASLSGVGALLLGRLGIKSRDSGNGYSGKALFFLTVLCLCLAGMNMVQYQQNKDDEYARMASTLSRPAQFDGTRINDASLQETAFSQQQKHELGVSTERVQELLNAGQNGDKPRLFDVRESGEYEMGTLPGAPHLRFPDFLELSNLSPGERVVLFCHNGNRSSETCAALAQLGIDCQFITGGIEKWIVEGRSFTDPKVRGLSDLRALPEYPNKSTLIGSQEFTEIVENGGVQIVDTRYPGDFDIGHLPGAINIPVRALKSLDLLDRIAKLSKKPTIAACYDRRSCFMAQVLGLELTRAGIPFLGRYTTPWDYFVPPAPKPHVQAWLEDQNTTTWARAVAWLAGVLVAIGDRSHLIVALGLLAFATRLAVLPVAIKAEKDQIALNVARAQLNELKSNLRDDPVRRGRAMRDLYNDLGLTPGRNMLALLFLPVTMLGVSAAQQAGLTTGQSLLWLSGLGVSDPTYVLSIVVAALGVFYVRTAVARTARQKLIWTVLAGPGLLALVAPLNAAAQVYIVFALLLLLFQRVWITGQAQQSVRILRTLAKDRLRGRVPEGCGLLGHALCDELTGKKALRLAEMKAAGFPVPSGLIIGHSTLAELAGASGTDREKFARKITGLLGQGPFAVRSSAANEDGENQSFAGVFDSALAVSPDNLGNAIQQVHRSFQSDRAQSYDQMGGVAASVLVQKMVNAEYAGVLFTTDPAGPGMCMIEMVKGNGEALVSGLVTPETYRIGRFSELANDNTPSPIDFKPLLTLGQEIEALFGCPQDIEWAYSQGQYSIVQSRDITTTNRQGPDRALRAAEWQGVFSKISTDPKAHPDAIVLEQDEMSEVLPRPTPLSFALMAQIWSPGGSVDLACRALDVPYSLPEGRDGHLLLLFGKTYVDSTLKQRMRLQLTERTMLRLRKQAGEQTAEFTENVIPVIAHKSALWAAMKYEKLSVGMLLEQLRAQQAFLVKEAYVAAEKVNILAGFVTAEAGAKAGGDVALNQQLMQFDLPHAPTSLLGGCARLGGETGRAKALEMMGHRAMFDYELSSPRYSEAPALLWPLLVSPVTETKPREFSFDGIPSDMEKSVALAMELQDLKERAKHEALRIYSEMRRALVALGALTGLHELVFYLTLDELSVADWSDVSALVTRAAARRSLSERHASLAPRETRLTLRQCEQLSVGLSGSVDDSGMVQGQCVSGEGVATGRVFYVPDDATDASAAMVGFQDGDIIVCRMVHPAWLPWVLRSSAVVSEVGGWLSHMAIVAREKQIMMVVGCRSIHQFETGSTVSVFDNGELCVAPDEVSAGVA